MSLTLYYHPFSSYCQKVLIALYEAGTAFDAHLLDFSDPEAGATLVRLWPIGRFPVLVDAARGQTIPETSIIIEYLDRHYPGASPLLPLAEDARLEVRLLDRFFDNYVMTPMQKIVADRIREPAARDPQGVTEARAMLDKAYRWLADRMAERQWAVSDAFTLADCAAAPALFYAHWVHPIPATAPHVAAYLARLRRRPSFARAVDEARPYRPMFPGGEPAHAD